MAPRLFSRISSKRGYRPHRYMLIRYRYVPSYVVYCMAMTITITMSTFLPPLASKGRKKGRKKGMQSMDMFAIESSWSSISHDTYIPWSISHTQSWDAVQFCNPGCNFPLSDRCSILIIVGLTVTISDWSSQKMLIGYKLKKYLTIWSWNYIASVATWDFLKRRFLHTVSDSNAFSEEMSGELITVPCFLHCMIDSC